MIRHAPFTNLTNQIKRNLFQLNLSVPTVKFPCLDLLSLLQKCTNKNHLNQIHAQMITTGLIHYPPAASKLVASFALCPLPGTTCVAQSVADQIDGLDAYTWNTIIRGYLEEKNPIEAILVYPNVRRKGLKVDSHTLLFLIKACGLILGFHEGEQIHGQIYKMGFVSEIIVLTALLQMYGLFDALESAQKVFDESPQRDLVQWNAIVAAHSKGNNSYRSLLVFLSMVNENVRPNGVTAVSILSACSRLRFPSVGKQVHGYVVRNLVSLDVFVYNALINMYSQCGCLLNALLVFQMMPVRNVVSYTSMINGYSDNNYPDEALALFKELESTNIRPDEITMLGVVSMCSKLGSFEVGEWIDDYIGKNGFLEESISMANAVMDMHAKCDNIKKACKIFDQMQKKTQVSWTIMIQGLAMHSNGIPALVRFSQMLREGFRPDCIVFLSILSACSHAGLVDEGRKCFQSMKEDHDMKPWMEHYGCMVDLLCKAGLVSEAFELVGNMPMKPDGIMWRILLGACRNQGNPSLTGRVMNHLLELEPKYSGNYVLLSNVYATMGEWDTVKNVRTEMGIRGVVKREPGCSLILVN